MMCYALMLQAYYDDCKLKKNVHIQLWVSIFIKKAFFRSKYIQYALKLDELHSLHLNKYL